MLFRRSAPADAPSTGSAPGAATDQADKAGGKGRPTPKRREAEAQRKAQLKATPKTRREAAALQRKETREQRMRQRVAMEKGDERYYGKRDQGPVRAFVRDFVDSRRSVAEYFLPLLVLILVLSFVNTPTTQALTSTLWVTVMLLVVGDTLVLRWRLKKAIRREFPDETGRGHVAYGLMRSTQMRRLRLPRPRNKPGRRPKA